MKKLSTRISWAVPLLAIFGSALAADGGGATSLEAELAGLTQVPTAITTGHAHFQGTLDEAAAQITYEMSFSNLEGAPIHFADIHLGQPFANGGIIVFLCSTTPPAGVTPPANTQACPKSATGTITGTITKDNIIGPAGQGITPQDFAKVLQAIRKGVTYAQIHTTGFPTGELRGQIRLHD